MYPCGMRAIWCHLKIEYFLVDVDVVVHRFFLSVVIGQSAISRSGISKFKEMKTRRHRVLTLEKFPILLLKHGYSLGGCHVNARVIVSEKYKTK